MPAYLGLGRSWLEEVGGGTDTTTMVGLYIGHPWRGALQGLFLPECWELGRGGVPAVRIAWCLALYLGAVHLPCAGDGTATVRGLADTHAATAPHPPE